MSENRVYKPIGGVLSAELFPVWMLASVEDVAEGSGMAVSLMDDGSLYEELFSTNEGLVSVCHTLTLVAEQEFAQVWLDADFQQRCACEGVVALLKFSSGSECRVGWSEKFGFEQALRLESLRFTSGKEPTDTPRVELKLRSCDTLSAIV